MQFVKSLGGHTYQCHRPEETLLYKIIQENLETFLKLGTNGQVIYRLKKPYDDGTTAISMTKLELLERLAAIVPRPKVHLTRFAEVFAPHYKHRAMVVPKSPNIKTTTQSGDTSNDTSPGKSRISWARLLKRVFGSDFNACHLCGGNMKIIAAIENPLVIKKILSHLNLPTKAPTPWPARGPPPCRYKIDHSFRRCHSAHQCGNGSIYYFVVDENGEQVSAGHPSLETSEFHLKKLCRAGRLRVLQA